MVTSPRNTISPANCVHENQFSGPANNPTRKKEVKKNRKLLKQFITVLRCPKTPKTSN